MLPLLLLLQGSHAAETPAAATGGVDIISAFAKLPSGATSIYSMHYSDQGCNNSTSSSSFVSMRGFLPGNVTTYHPTPADANANATCTKSSVCSVLFNSKDDDRCPVEGNFAGEVSEENGDVYLYYNGSLTDFTRCGSSSWYPGCSFEYFSLAALKSNPALLANSNPTDLEAMKDFIYYVFYEDGKCTEPASIWSSMDKEEVTVDIVSNYTEYSCAVRSACVIDPSSPLCEALRDGPDHTASFVSVTELDQSTGEQKVYVCDSSNVEVAQDECSVISPRDCIASSLIPGCHVRFFSGPTFAKHPRVLIGDMTGLPSVEGDGSQMTAHQGSSANKVSLALGIYVLALCQLIWS